MSDRISTERDLECSRPLDSGLEPVVWHTFGALPPAWEVGPPQGIGRGERISRPVPGGEPCHPDGMDRPRATCGAGRK